MTNDLLWQPDIFAIGQTQFNSNDFESWLKFNDHTDAFADGDSPIANHLLQLAQDSAPSVFGDMTTTQVDDGYDVPIIVAA